MSTSLLQIGKYGVLNAQTLLNTTSNNVNNVTTEGYTRRTTVTYTNTIDWGIGETVTSRVYDVYVQRELYADEGEVGYYTAYQTGMSTVDSILSDDDMSVSVALDDFFDSLSDSAENPTSLANREETLATLETVVQRFNTIYENMYDQIDDVNARMQDDITTINALTEAIRDLNKQIKACGSDDQTEAYLQMLDERDLLISELSTLVEINVIEQSDGTYCVYLSGNGQLLANGETYATLELRSSDTDASTKEVWLSYGSNPDDDTYVQMTSDGLGGELGGYMDSTEEIRVAMKELGQLALAFADALNEQNKSGITLEGVFGSDLLSMDPVYAQSDDSDYSLKCVFVDGEGSNITTDDYYVTFKSGNLVIYTVDTDGTETKVLEVDSDGNEVINETGLDFEDLWDIDDEGNLVLNLGEFGGIEMDFNATYEELCEAGVTFYLQPTILAAYNLSTEINSAEEFAFAAGVRVNTSTENVGSAVISLESMTSNACLETDSDGNITLTDDAPVEIIIDDDGNYVIYNSDGEAIGIAPASCNGANIFANAYTYDSYSIDADGNMTGDAFADEDYPGYEVSITGTVYPQDSFEIEVNTDGDADNTNGVALSELRSADLVRSGSASSTVTLTEAYANLTSSFGSKLYAAETSLEAAEAKRDQTETLYDSVAGVNLDEEAANLLLYQQTYQACAKIIEAAQTVFDALIEAV